MKRFIYAFLCMILFSCSPNKATIEINKIGLNENKDILYFSLSESAEDNLRSIIYFGEEILLDTICPILEIDSNFVLPKVAQNTSISIQILNGSSVAYEKEIVVYQDRTFLGMELYSTVMCILCLWLLTLAFLPSILMSNSLISWRLGFHVSLLTAPVFLAAIASVFIVNSMVVGVSRYNIGYYLLLFISVVSSVVLTIVIHKKFFHKKNRFK